MRAANNRTLEVSEAEAETLLARCLHPDSPLTAADAEDSVLHGDCLELMPLLPRGFADLLIADPPYNLSKDYHGEAFRHMPDADYAAYTEHWLDLALPLLKPGGSVYFCCDWRTSVVIAPLLQKRLKLRNRLPRRRDRAACRDRGACAHRRSVPALPFPPR